MNFWGQVDIFELLLIWERIIDAKELQLEKSGTRNKKLPELDV